MSSSTSIDWQPLPEYTWLIAVGSLAAFLFGYATGANDVANAFATSVGSKALTLLQAVCIAGVFEFLGAMLLARVSTDVIAGKIADVDVFTTDLAGPPAYAYGMVCALTIGGFWQLWASWAGYNVSATQSIIGGIIGFSMVYGGAGAVNWATPNPDNWPPYNGVVPVVVSWVLCPLLTATSSIIIFGTLRAVVLRSPNAVSRAYWVLPIAVFLTGWLCSFFVMAKGAAKTLVEKHPTWTNKTFAWISAICGAVCMVFALMLIPFIKKRVATMEAEDEASNTADFKSAAAGVESKSNDVENGQDMSKPPVAAAPVSGVDSADKSSRGQQLKDALTKGVKYDIFEVIETDATVSGIHSRAEKFDRRSEYVFSFLQVFSATCVSFSHGAGEVGYMAGPLTAIWDVISFSLLLLSWKTGEVSKKVDPKTWILVYTAFSLVIGLATYGYNVMRAMGTEICKLTPSRGFSAELSTATVILMASQWGLPTSSSQAITGGIIGVGLLEGTAGVNWVFIVKQFMAWVGTLVVVGLGTAGLYAQGVYSPCI
ncbi:unnamed protein product [Phaeothamnion confervicola]